MKFEFILYFGIEDIGGEKKKMLANDVITQEVQKRQSYFSFLTAFVKIPS